MPNARPKTVIAEQAAIMVRRLDELRGFTLLIVIVALQRGWMVDRCSVFYPFVQRMILSGRLAGGGLSYALVYCCKRLVRSS